MNIGALEARVQFSVRPWWTWWWHAPRHFYRHYRCLRRKEDKLFSVLGAVYLALHKVEVVR